MYHSGYPQTSAQQSGPSNLRDVRSLEAEVLTDVQQRLVTLTRNLDNHNGRHIVHQPTVRSS